MLGKIKISKLLKVVVFLVLLPLQLYAQQKERTTFILEEYSIKDSNFYNDLCSVLFSDTIFDTRGNYFFAMEYNTNAVHIDDETEETFSANFTVFDLMDGNTILHVTKNGKGVIGYFYINNRPCFILNSTQNDFIFQYLMPADKKRRFTFRERAVEGGFTDVYMNILPNGEIEIVRVLKCE